MCKRMVTGYPRLEQTQHSAADLVARGVDYQRRDILHRGPKRQKVCMHRENNPMLVHVADNFARDSDTSTRGCVFASFRRRRERGLGFRV
jgi:hypothetical protein